MKLVSLFGCVKRGIRGKFLEVGLQRGIVREKFGSAGERFPGLDVVMVAEVKKSEAKIGEAVVRSQIDGHLIGVDGVGHVVEQFVGDGEL